jgi:hypothetical protein
MVTVKLLAVMCLRIFHFSPAEDIRPFETPCNSARYCLKMTLEQNITSLEERI